jgi:hypothetical protein
MGFYTGQRGLLQKEFFFFFSRVSTSPEYYYYYYFSREKKKKRERELGDELLKGCEHTTRHNRVVAAWVRDVQAARGAAHTRATAEAPAWSAPSVPDFVSEYAGQAGAHQVGEVKVYNTIVTDAAQLLRGATQAFGATRARLLKENLGDFTPSEVVAPRSDGAARTAK